MSEKSSELKNVYLPKGFKLQRYTIQEKAKPGGFGIVYLARREDGLSVAIKEFLPASLRCRTAADNGRVSFDNTDDARKFKDGLNSFFQEADTVAKIRDPQIIEILDVFEANGTAYFVMPYERGCSLHDYIKYRGGRIADAEIRDLFIYACSGLQVLHEHDLLHLDIKPGNLWVRPDNSLILLDLGASRNKYNYHLFGPSARTPGYAAPEQHSSLNKTANVPLTVKTDTYGIATSMYACIEGSAPPAANLRVKENIPLSIIRRGQSSSELLKLIDRGMSLDVKGRIPSAEEFKSLLLGLPRLKYECNFYNLKVSNNAPKLPPIESIIGK